MAVTLGSSYDAREVTTTTTKHSRSDEDGIRVIDTRARRKRGRIVLARVVALGAAIGLIAVLARAPVEREKSEAPPVAELEVGAAPSVEAATAVAAKPIGKPVARAPSTAPPPPSPPPTQADEERALERKLADEPGYTIAKPGSPKSGMALFPAPGSDPLLRGIVVPEDFELPEGYVRHHQVTDDGEPLPAILMFHPDYEWVDENGESIELPADRVVPPELAPEGLPIELLAPPGAGGSGPGSSS